MEDSWPMEEELLCACGIRRPNFSETLATSNYGQYPYLPDDCIMAYHKIQPGWSTISWPILHGLYMPNYAQEGSTEGKMYGHKAIVTWMASPVG
jgi:hypothetical protein